ncbi:unnamed protein product [Phytophthora fragariaefolia]|uniref:Unnamed protein product n=1 Tax=Phytophthora fragariaefolia TaxID=1490495 RepID=A0A9W7DBE1_9STRA|nr:unnamed protein product [Phytophthora fragariaefolia]
MQISIRHFSLRPLDGGVGLSSSQLSYFQDTGQSWIAVHTRTTLKDEGDYANKYNPNTLVINSEFPRRRLPITPRNTVNNMKCGSQPFKDVHHNRDME